MKLYLDIFITFFKIGIVSFGGGYAMIPIIQGEVEAHYWLEKVCNNFDEIGLTVYTII